MCQKKNIAIDSPIAGRSFQLIGAAAEHAFIDFCCNPQRELCSNVHSMHAVASRVRCSESSLFRPRFHSIFPAAVTLIIFRKQDNIIHLAYKDAETKQWLWVPLKSIEFHEKKPSKLLFYNNNILFLEIAKIAALPQNKRFIPFHRHWKGTGWFHNCLLAGLMRCSWSPLNPAAGDAAARTDHQGQSRRIACI